MRNTPRDETVLLEFKRRRTRQLISSGLVILIMLPLILKSSGSMAIFGLSERVVLVTAVTLIVGAVLFSLYNWRCPACNRYLGKSFNPSFCSGCGVQLRV